MAKWAKYTINKGITITPEQLAGVQTAAEEDKVPDTEIIRQAIDLYLARRNRQQTRQRA